MLLHFYLDPTITDFFIITTSLQLTCLNSDLYHNFILVCRARKPSVVIPQLQIQWLRNDTQRGGDVSVRDDGAYVVNFLNVSEAIASDTGLYRCVASIVIPDSPTIMISDSSIAVSITGKCSC